MDINDDNYPKAIAGADKPLFLLFRSTFCAPSVIFSEHIEDARYEFGDSITIVEIDVEDCPRLSRAMQVKGTPTTICFASGEPIASHLGTQTMDQFLDWIESCVKKINKEGGKK